MIKKLPVAFLGLIFSIVGQAAPCVIENHLNYLDGKVQVQKLLFEKGFELDRNTVGKTWCDIVVLKVKSSSVVEVDWLGQPKTVKSCSYQAIEKNYYDPRYNVTPREHIVAKTNCADGVDEFLDVLESAL